MKIRKILILCSTRDPASFNTFKIFLENGFQKIDSNTYELNNYMLKILDEDLLFLKNLEGSWDVVVFVSKHSSKERIPCLTVHADGNFGKAVLGGKNEELSIAHALYMKKALVNLAMFREENFLDNYRVSLEVTHHGPNLNFPSFWIEVGSTLENWKDKKACEVVASTVLNLDKVKLENDKVIVGFGGPHYAPNFTKLVLTKNYAVGHIIPKYALDIVSENLIKKAYIKTYPKPDFGVIDWKGAKKEHRVKIISVFEKEGWNLKRLDDL